jgi:hypothetical protein
VNKKATIHDVEKDEDGITFDGRRSMTFKSGPLSFHGFIRVRGGAIIVVLDAQDNSAFNASAHGFVGKILKMVDSDVRALGGTAAEGTPEEIPGGGLLSSAAASSETK